jgi:hypothetical protein
MRSSLWGNKQQNDERIASGARFEEVLTATRRVTERIGEFLGRIG